MGTYFVTSAGFIDGIPDLCFKRLDDQNNVIDFSLEDFEKYGSLFLD